MTINEVYACLLPCNYIKNASEAHRRDLKLKGRIPFFNIRKTNLNVNLAFQKACRQLSEECKNFSATIRKRQV